MSKEKILKELQTSLVFDKGKSRNILSLLMQLEPELLRVATAFLGARAFGFLTKNTSKPFKFKMLAGFRDEGEQVTFALRKSLVYIKQMIQNGPPDETRPVLVALYRGIKEEESIIKYFEAKHLNPLHAKVYIADDIAALIGSPNFSVQGMVHNIESLKTTTSASEVAYLTQQFEIFFEQAIDITPQILEILEEQLFQEPLTPYEFYQLCLHHLYPIFSGASDSFVLANYQRDMVTMAIRMLQEQKRCLFIAPTGTGKTVMGAEIAAQFQKIANLIDRVVVICPSGLEQKWKEHMIEYGIFCEAFSHQEVGFHDSSSNEIYVNKVLSNLGNRSLLIVDETHNYRNLKATSKRKKGHKLTSKVQQLLRVQNRMDRPFSLGLTATPYSREWKDVENQLAIIGEATTIKTVDDLDRQPLLHITLPFITQKYASHDGEGAYLNMGEKVWRFDTIEVVTQEFVFQYPDIIKILEELTFVTPYSRVAQNHKTLSDKLLFLQDSWPDDDFEEISGALLTASSEDAPEIPDQCLPGQGRWRLSDENKIPQYWMAFRIPAYTILKAALSSPQAFVQVIESFLSNLQTQIILNREQVRDWLRELLVLAQAMVKKPDAKCKLLVDICSSIPRDEKILVFCERITTLEVLRRFLLPIRPDVTLITGKTRQKDKFIKRFAPIANRYDFKKNENELFTLIATDCISEGVDIQDAQHLINYDLPWSPIKLVQRLGRLDRPSSDKRLVKLYNFVPQPDVSKMILRFYSLIRERSNVYKTVNRINLLDEETRTVDDLMEGEVGFIQLFLSQNLTIDDLRDWTNNIKVTDHLLELSRLTSKLRQRFDDLPAHARSARKTKGKQGYFTLFKYRDDYHILITDSQGIVYPETLFEPSLSRLVDTISCQPDEPLLELPDIENFDRAVGTALKRWADNCQPPVNPDDILEIGSIALL